MSAANGWRKVIRGEAKGIGSRAFRALLSAVEPLYRSIVARKNRQFDSGRVSPTRVVAPVVSVGNLTVGGTGKTPLVVWLARWFRERGIAVTIISRGYGAKRGKPNDEALEIASRLPDVPHLQNPDRVAAAREALQTTLKQVLILDDAFQHRRIARDLDIVLLDALDPFGAGHLLPRGLLREPVESLARADVVALSRADAVDEAARERIRHEVARLAPRALWMELEHRPAALVNHQGEEAPLERLQGAPVAAFCGIGNPAGFRHTLAELGCELVALREFADHFAYGPADLENLEQWLAGCGEATTVVCTHKDLVKIPRDTLAGKRLWAVRIELAIRVGQAELEERLRALAAALEPEGNSPSEKP